MKEKGFVEGTRGITTGDPMKDGDHRRDKRSCRHHSGGYCSLLSQKCCSSSHCGHYDDGKPVTIIEKPVPNLHTHEKLFRQFLTELRNRICHNSLEGNYICRSIMAAHGLTRADINKADLQIQEFDLQKKLLKEEILAFNSNLKSKCILFGLFIITAPFSYAYYQSHLRDAYKEVEALRERIIDSCLQQRKDRYLEELGQYKKASELADRKRGTYDRNEPFYCRALLYHKEGDYEHFFEMILKSIKEKNNITAISFLLKSAYPGKNNDEKVRLLLYASYLGDKDSSLQLSKMLLSRNKDSKIGKKFEEKATR